MWRTVRVRGTARVSTFTVHDAINGNGRIVHCTDLSLTEPNPR